jgi:hypothetical protein
VGQRFAEIGRRDVSSGGATLIIARAKALAKEDSE